MGENKKHELKRRYQQMFQQLSRSGLRILSHQNAFLFYTVDKIQISTTPDSTRMKSQIEHRKCGKEEEMYVNTRSHKLCAITIISSASSLEGRNEILIDTHIEPKPNALPVILRVCMCAHSVCNLPLARITCLFVIKLTLNLIFFRLFIR